MDIRQHQPTLVIVTGLSGAGLTTALNTLQDSGFYCIDNLPLELLLDTVAFVEQKKIHARGFAFGMDIRDHKFSSEFPKMKKSLAERVNLDVLFIDADEEVLSKRYSSTRRRHPLIEPKGDLNDAIQREISLLKPVRKSADGIIDTTMLKPADLSRLIESRYSDNKVILRTLFVTLSSFGFKHGGLSHAEGLHDVRFLPNPFFDKELKNMTGLDKGVQEYVMKSKVSQQTYERIESLYRFLLPHYLEEGKHYLRVGVGCTGGQHRSVTIVELLGKSFVHNPIPGVSISLIHRDL